MTRQPPSGAGGPVSELSTFLTGVKVLDLSQYIPGPMATLFLADMGAEVIKIEPPHGDSMETLGPRDAEGQPIFYRAMNAGKLIRRMDLKAPAERQAFLEMVASADVIVEGFRPGVMARLNVDYPVLCGVNPGIILCSISGYGVGALLAKMAGHDANYLALMGALDRNGTDKPAFYDPPVSDVTGSLFSAIAILGALQRRIRTGKGCQLDLALADTVMPIQMMQVAAFGANGVVPERGGYYLNGGAAYCQVYSTRDGRHVALGAVEPKFWRAFCERAGRLDWISRQDEPMPQTVLIDEVAALFSSIDALDAVELFGDTDCCFSIVNNLGQALAQDQVIKRGLVQTNDSGALQALFPVRVNGLAPDPRPDLSYYFADTASGLSDKEIARAAPSISIRETCHDTQS